MSKLHAAARSLALAEAAANLGSWAEADRLVSEFLQVFPDAANGLYVKAGIAFNGFRKLEEATSLLERVLARDGNNIKARRLLAVLQWTGGNKAAFEKNMELVLAADPADGQAHYYMGRYLFEKGELAQAREQLETAERLRPFDYRVATDLARTYAAAGLLQRAEEKHRAAVAILGQWPQKDPLVYTNYAEFLLGQHRPAPALELLDRILSVPRPLPRALYLAGVAYAAEGKSTEAVQFLKRAEESTPDDPQVHLALAEVYERAGSKGEAEVQRARAAKAGPAPEPQVQR
jgi:tetratricopeptide (TPR) repeat protein